MTSVSELQQLQDSQGAVRSTAASTPLHFGNPQEEFLAARNETALFDLTGRTQLELTGADRQKFLHSFCTNEIRNLKPGQSCEAFVTTIQGKVFGHIYVFAEENSLWIDSVAGWEDRLYAHLDKYLISEKVQFHRRSAEFTDFYVSGPQSAVRLDQLALPATGLELHRHTRSQLEGIPISIRRVDWLKELGFLLQVPTSQAAAAWKSFTDSVLKPAGHEAFEGLRILAMLPHYGIDITEDNLAQEVARTDRAISFNKGCYLGQEPIARIDSMGHVNQELRGLRLDSGPLPSHLAKVLMPGEVREAGIVTSSAWDYSQNTPVALAVLKRNYMSAGKRLHVLVSEQEVPSTVFDRS
ncbi:MAG: folate-binding protein YgfZ [Planctomycetaceae bacterium]|nr:folate-binding protein YgfZ [Planctomycetaceae bacterium]